MKGLSLFAHDPELCCVIAWLLGRVKKKIVVVAAAGRWSGCEVFADSFSAYCVYAVLRETFVGLMKRESRFCFFSLCLCTTMEFTCIYKGY